MLGAPSLEGVRMEAGPTILLRSGSYFDLLRPEASTFTILDIAHALSNLCRFTGHTHRFLSVAEHSVYVSQLVPREDTLAGLLHDAAEAFVGDVSRPLKSLLPEYRVIEDRVSRAVLSRFGLDPVLPDSVGQADRVMLRAEQFYAMRYDDVWPGLLPEVVIEPQFLPPEAARFLFLQRYFELTGERHG